MRGYNRNGYKVPANSGIARWRGVGEDRLEFLLVSHFFRENLEETVLGAWSVMADSPRLHGRAPGLHTTALINSSPMCKDLCSSPRLCVQLLRSCVKESGVWDLRLDKGDLFT